MKKSKAFFFVSLLVTIIITFAPIIYSQQTLNGIQTYNFVTPVPTGVNGGNARATVAGANTYYYWIITNFVRGKVQPVKAIQIDRAPVPAVATPITVVWNPVVGAVSYDVIRTTTATFPGNCAACQIGLAVGVPTITDVGGAVAYNVWATFGNGLASLSVNNRDYTTPTIQVKNNGGVDVLRIGGTAVAPTLVVPAASTFTGATSITGATTIVGATSITGNTTLAAANTITWTGRSVIQAPAVGEVGITRSAGNSTALRLEATAFANLPAAGAGTNGLIIYCNDCAIGAVCAGAGTGAIAKGINAGWVCN